VAKNSPRKLSKQPGGVPQSDSRSAFTYRRGRINNLFCESLSLAGLADRFGTPLYVYSARAVEQRYLTFDRAFRGFPHLVCYSVKANSNLSILSLLGKLGAGFDVVSGGELERVRHIDRRSDNKVVFSGVGKTREEIDLALRAGLLLFNVESESELQALAERAEYLRKTAPLALRVNPDVPAETHPYISTGLHRHKFGIPISQARELYARAARYRRLDVAGISVHIGSQITDTQPFAATMERVADLVRQLQHDGHNIRYVDAGGGLGIAYDDIGLPAFTEYVEQYARALIAPLRTLKVKLLLEPGRIIVGPAGVLLTRVLYRKRNDGKQFLVVDAAMNDLIRPSLYNAHHEIWPAQMSADKVIVETTDVVGPVCETGDFFARDRELPKVEERGLLAIMDAGAYGMALASNYNTRPRPAEVLVNGKAVRVIRKRERIADLFRGEI